MARPTILNDKIMGAFEAVLTEGINAFILTDEELVILVNDHLPSAERFSYSAFKDWKAFAIQTKEDTTPDNMEKYIIEKKCNFRIRGNVDNAKRNI